MQQLLALLLVVLSLNLVRLGVLDLVGSIPQYICFVNTGISGYSSHPFVILLNTCAYRCVNSLLITLYNTWTIVVCISCKQQFQKINKNSLGILVQIYIYPIWLSIGLLTPKAAISNLLYKLVVDFQKPMWNHLKKKERLL